MMRPATCWPVPRLGGMADVETDPVDIMPVVDMSTHPKVYCCRWFITYDVFCTLADLPTKEHRARLRLLGVPRDNPKPRRG